MKLISKQKNLKGKKVLLRVDFNVPMESDVIVDDARIRASIPTIRHLSSIGARVVIVAHLGRPEGRRVSALSLEPVRERLEKLLKRRVVKIETGNWKLSDKKWQSICSEVGELRVGQIAMFDNIRFSPDEDGDTNGFSEKLARCFDIFVNDGFSVSHRASASVVGVTKYLPSYAGLLMEREVLGLDRVLKTPKSPFVAIVGGAKMETKIPVMRSILKIADSLLIGGGIINTYLKSLGFGVGGSIVDDGALDLARQICRNKKVIKPLDLVVGTMDGSSWRIVEIGSSLHSLCESGEAIFDIGPMTIELYDSIIAKARTIVWNGAMGYFEVSPYHIGTLSIADMIADRSDRAHTVIGGGETLLSMDMIGRTGEIGLVSTGGGAMLEYLSGEVLPGVEVLDRII